MLLRVTMLSWLYNLSSKLILVSVCLWIFLVGGNKLERENGLTCLYLYMSGYIFACNINI